MAGKNVHEITEANFQKTVLGSDKPFLVDFWATWCGPCLAIAPHVEALADANVGKLEVGKVNIDDHPGVAGQFGVRSIPTLILFKGGKPVDQIVGAVPRAKLEEMVKKHA
jgi:thioredoxin 1